MNERRQSHCGQARNFEDKNNSSQGGKEILSGSAISGFPRIELEDTSSSDSGSDRSICHNDNDECYLVVKCDSVEALTEQDIV